jgi:hypothetical protein
MQRLSRSRRFSGKLSFVTPTSEDSEPSTLPAEPELAAAAKAPPEIGGRDGPEPTRFGDWELRGRCIDF